MSADYSLSARHILTWDHLEVEPGPDRLVLAGRSDVSSKTSHSTSIGLRYDQIDQLIIDLLTVRRDHGSS